MADKTNQLNGLSRRTVLKASAVGAGVLGAVAPATGDEYDDDGENDYKGDADDDDEYKNEEGGDDELETEDQEEEDESEIDEPDGFEVEVLAPHAPFPDDLAARFCLEYADDHHGDPINVDVDDASTIVVAQVTWSEDSTSGWHRHPGPYIVTMVEGEIETTYEHDCVPRTYAAGDAWFGTGGVHIADSDDGAMAYVTFLGIPDGQPATEWVEPVDC